MRGGYLGKYIEVLSVDYTGMGYKKQTEILKSQALKRNGVFRRSYITGERSFSFSHNNLNVTIGYTERAVHHTNTRGIVIRAKFKISLDIKLVVQFRDMLSGYNTVGLKDIKTENPIFNEKFVMRGNERDFAINLINSEIQNKFLQLGNEYYYPMMKITKDKFSLACSNFSTELYESTDYDKLIDFAIVILDDLRKLCVIQIPGLDF